MIALLCSLALAGSLTISDDFVESSGATAPDPWATQDTSAAGSPTLAYVDDADNGEFVLTLAATDEAEKITLYWGDSLHVDATSGAVIEGRIKVTGTLSADDRAVCGLASARNATLDSVATHAWIRVEGANNNILFESDDGTTDDDDNDAQVDWTSGTYFDFEISLADLSRVRFYVDGALVGTTSMAAATGNLQPFCELQKDAGTVTHSLTVDYLTVTWDR